MNPEYGNPEYWKDWNIQDYEYALRTKKKLNEAIRKHEGWRINDPDYLKEMIEVERKIIYE